MEDELERIAETLERIENEIGNLSAQLDDLKTQLKWDEVSRSDTLERIESALTSIKDDIREDLQGELLELTGELRSPLDALSADSGEQNTTLLGILGGTTWNQMWLIIITIILVLLLYRMW